jgi:hypothetical protein
MNCFSLSFAPVIAIAGRSRHGELTLLGGRCGSNQCMLKIDATYSFSFHRRVICPLSPAQVVRDVVFTSNESPPSEPIPWHHEMAQTANPPSHILFYCDVPAKEGEYHIVILPLQSQTLVYHAPVCAGGATPIVRSDVVMSQLQASAAESQCFPSNSISFALVFRIRFLQLPCPSFTSFSFSQQI